MAMDPTQIAGFASTFFQDGCLDNGDIKPRDKLPP